MTHASMRLDNRPSRDTRVDIIRGWLQLTIFASHAAGSWIGAWLIHGAWGLSDSSEQFVFLSGLMLGSVFARKSGREGFRAASRDMAVRTWRLYRTHLITFFLFAGMIIAVTDTGLCPGEVKRLGWSFLMAHPAHAIAAVLTTLYQPNYMDILPVFIWSMALLPAFAWLERRIGAWALTAPFGLYLAAWLFGLTPPSLGPDTVIGFNPLAWQMLFLLGVCLGRRMLLNGRALTPSRPLTIAAVLVLVVGLLLRLNWFGALPFDLGIPESAWIIGKDELALPRVVHALALALIVARLIPREALWMHTPLGPLAGGLWATQPAGLLPGSVSVLGGDGGVPVLAAAGDAARPAADHRRLRDPAVVWHVAGPRPGRRTSCAEPGTAHRVGPPGLRGLRLFSPIMGCWKIASVLTVHREKDLHRFRGAFHWLERAG